MSDKKNLIQKIIIIASILAFVGSTGMMAASLFTTPNQAQQAPQSQAEAAQQQLLTAEKGYEQVLAREPNNQFALQQLITVRLELGKFQESIEPLEKLLEGDPKNQQALQALAAVQIRTGNFDGAIAPLEKLVALNPNQPELKDQLEKLKQQVAELKKSGKTAPNSEEKK